MGELGSLCSYTDCSWWVFTLPAFLGTDSIFNVVILLLPILATFLVTVLLTWAMSPGGAAWRHCRNRMGPTPIPGTRGLPVLRSLLTLSSGLPHRALAAIARVGPGSDAKVQLMAFSIGATPAVVSSDPTLSREILSHPYFADRPLKHSARELMFGPAMGFAPSGAHWRLLRRVAASHLFSSRRVAAHEPGRQAECSAMLDAVAAEQASAGRVHLRHHLQAAALNNVTASVFGRRYDTLRKDDAGAAEIKSMVWEGFELLGAFNWSDHLPWLGTVYDPHSVSRRCTALVGRVWRVVRGIIEEHRVEMKVTGGGQGRAGLTAPGDGADFVDVLLSLDGDKKLDEDDMIPVPWEMIFRGTDTTALLTEFAMAELVLNPTAQARLRAELDSVADPAAAIPDADAARLPYLQAVVKDTLRLHPPGPLLSWASLSTADVPLGNGMVVPAGTTAMVNMWAITHDPAIWEAPGEFRPGRFLPEEGGADVDVRGGDLRLAPFGAGRRVCPGKNLALATVGVWVARLVHQFVWAAAEGEPC